MSRSPRIASISGRAPHPLIRPKDKLAPLEESGSSQQERGHPQSRIRNCGAASHIIIETKLPAGALVQGEEVFQVAAHVSSKAQFVISGNLGPVVDPLHHG